jgi:hypothetical protein
MGCIGFPLQLATYMDRAAGQLKGPGRFHIRAETCSDKYGDSLKLSAWYMCPYQAKYWGDVWVITLVKGEYYQRKSKDKPLTSKTFKSAKVSPEQLQKLISDVMLYWRDQYLAKVEERRRR